MICCLFFPLRAQDYYWEKASNFPDQEANLNVTDLQAADGVIRFNKQWYTYDDAIAFKRIESLINQGPTSQSAFYWAGPEGKWVFDYTPQNVPLENYTLNSATREVKTFCATGKNYRYYSSLDKEKMLQFKNNYYTLGSITPEGTYEKRILSKYDPTSCQWYEITLPRMDGYADKLASDGGNLYIICNDINRGDIYCYVSQDAVNWKQLDFPTPILNNPWYYPKQGIKADKRGFLFLYISENDINTKEYRTRYFTLKDQVFSPLAMGGYQPEGRYARFKLFDSGNLYDLSSNNEILFSADKGDNWTRFQTINVPPTINDFIETRDGNVYIGTAEGVFVLKKFKDPRPLGCTDLTFTKIITDQTICKKGDVTFVVKGGTPPYSINFQDQTYTTSDSVTLTGLDNGYFELSIKDRNNCTVNTDFYINYIVKPAMQVTFSEKYVCTENFEISILKGYPPYLIRWKEGEEEKQQIFEKTSAVNAYTVARLKLDKDQLYQFTVSDQSGCASFQSLPQQGASFSPVLSYTGTANCDSLEVKINSPTSTFNQFKLIISNSLNKVISTQTWTGAEFTTKVLHNEYYNFQIVSVPSGCQKSFVKRFDVPKLKSFTVVGEGCIMDKKGEVWLDMANFNSSFHQMIWSDIGMLYTNKRTGLEAGTYTFEVTEETGCGIKKTFVITKEVPPTLPTVPFLCPGEKFTIVPQTTDPANITSFYALDQFGRSITLKNGQGVEVTNTDKSYSFYAKSKTTNCLSEKVTLNIQSASSVPEVLRDSYTFCTIGDKVLLTTSSPNVYWYSGLDSTLLGSGYTLEYITGQEKDSIHLFLQNQALTCQSNVTTIFLEQSIPDSPSIIGTTLNATQQLLKTISPHHDASEEYIYAWYGDEIFLKYGDSLIITIGEWSKVHVTATDTNGCTSQQSAEYVIGLPLSNEEKNTTALFSIYPNPTCDKLTVTINKGFVNGSITIKDLSGRSIWKTDHLQKTNDVSLGKCTSGIYLIEIQLDEQENLHEVIIKE